MNFSEAMYTMKAHDIYMRRPHWDKDTAICFNDDGILVFETNSVDYPYGLSFEDFEADDWDYLRTDR